MRTRSLADPYNEVNGAVALADLFEALARQRVALGRLAELQLGGSRLQVVAQEGGVVAVARGVDATLMRAAVGLPNGLDTVCEPMLSERALL